MTSPFATTVSVANRIVSAATNKAICLGLDEVVVDYPGAAAIILRCGPNPAPAGGSATVTVKQSNSKDQHLIREWANLQFLNAVAGARAVVPFLYGRDDDAELLVGVSEAWPAFDSD